MTIIVKLMTLSVDRLHGKQIIYIYKCI